MAETAEGDDAKMADVSGSSSGVVQPKDQSTSVASASVASDEIEVAPPIESF